MEGKVVNEMNSHGDCVRLVAKKITVGEEDTGNANNTMVLSVNETILFGCVKARERKMNAKGRVEDSKGPLS